MPRERASMEIVTIEDGREFIGQVRGAYAHLKVV
jgi:hypothetical protein